MINKNNRDSVKYIVVGYDTWQKAQLIKINDKFKSMDDLISKLLKDYERDKKCFTKAL